MTTSASEKLRKFYSCFESDDHVLVMINADPDAIASAMAVKRLLWRKTAKIVICSITAIKRPDNIAMVESLGVKIIRPEEVKKDCFSKFVIVDSQPDHNELFQKFEYNVIIDHHPTSDAPADFIDIRPEYGATSTILIEYLKAAKIKPSTKLATGLFLGIKTDTDGFTRHSIEADVKAFRFVFQYINTHLVYRIQHTEILPSYLKYFQKAINTKRVVNKRAFIHLGQVGSGDICVIIADFFMRMSKIKWSIVSGIYGKKLIIIFRSDGLRTDCGKLASNVFGILGSGGGHKTMARSEIPLDAISDLVEVQNEKKLLSWIIRITKNN